MRTQDGFKGCRSDFPILKQIMHNGSELVYLDNAASTQKPQVVIDCLSHYYSHDNANVHRGVHALSQRATDQYEASRETVRAFVGASSIEEIIFTRGTTEAVNLVVAGLRGQLQPGQNVAISAMEHHSNIVPWQRLCNEKGAELRILPMDESGTLKPNWADQIDDQTFMVAVVHMSNALGTINPVREIVEVARKHGAYSLIDGAQALAHTKVNVQELGCDFYASSGHKLYGPTGIGLLYGKTSVLETMDPYQSGGDMIRTVSFEETTYNDLPYRFEAGTPNIAGSIGLAAAINYLEQFDLDEVGAYENALAQYASAQLAQIEGVRLIGTAEQKGAVVSFVVDGIHSHDIGMILDEHGIAIRVGHHCAQPVMDFYGIAGTARASFAIYNNVSDVDRLVDGLKRTVSLFR